MSQNFPVFAWDRRSRLIGFPDFAVPIIRIPGFSAVSFLAIPDYPDSRSLQRR